MLPSHSFMVGQDVEFLPGELHASMGHGIFRVLQLLPNDATDREYRIRSLVDGHERVVRESQLRTPQAAPR